MQLEQKSQSDVGKGISYGIRLPWEILELGLKIQAYQ